MEVTVGMDVYSPSVMTNIAKPTSIFLPSSELQYWELQLIQLSEQLTCSPMTLSSYGHLSMSMVQKPQVLCSPNICTLTQGSLTWFFGKSEYRISSLFHKVTSLSRCCQKIVHALCENVRLETEIIAFPLDKAESQYIAFDKANLVQGRCCGHSEVSPITVLHGYYMYSIYNMQQAMDLPYCNSRQLFEFQTELELGLNKAKHHELNNGHQCRADNRKIYIASRKVKGTTRSAEKSGFKYGVAVQESHRGPSALELPKEWNALNTLFKNTQLSSTKVLCLKSREVTIATTVRQQQSSSGQNLNTDNSNTKAFHQWMPIHQATSQRSSSARCTPCTNTYTQCHTTDDPTFSTQITQLLHASLYDDIIQQLQHILSNLPLESLIPTHFIIGVAYFKTSKYKKAKEHFKKYAALAEAAHQDGDVMLCNAYLGDMEYASQSFLEATEYYKKAVKHYTSESIALMFKLTPPTISAIHAKLASAFRNVSMMVQAIEHYQTAISKATTDRDKLSAHTSLGNLYQSMGDNTNALREYKKSIKLADVLSDHVSLGWTHGNIGNAYLGLNRKDEALHHLQKSLDLAIKYEQTPQAIGRTYNNLGTAYQSMNDLDKAEEYYDLALSQAVYGNDIAGQARVYGNIGNVHMLRKNYERAIPHYGEALHLSKDPSTISTAQHNRGCAYYEWATSLQQSHKDDVLKIHGPECDIDICLGNFSSKSVDLYRKGASDLEEVVKYHEERLQHVKGSASGLTLSASLFESNSRTFHRLQDCLFNLHMFGKALLVAELSRARTLGELLLKRKRKDSLRPPLKFDQVTDIVRNLSSPLIYFSYTGARLICWIFLPSLGELTMHTFDRPLADDQFDGKSFEYHLCYSLTEKLIERSFKMYQRIEYDSESSAEVRKLYDSGLVDEPIQSILLGHSITGPGFLQITSISDSYTAFLLLTCLQYPKSTIFFCDQYYFNSIPSLLTLGIMNQSADITIDVKDARNDFCVVGDPSIPPFKFNDYLWHLDRLPYARREAEWVAHALNITPILNEHATKSVFLSRLRRAKLVHIATHGSASAGFLAFAAFALRTNDGRNNTVDASNVLLFPEEVEKLHISPALVVLSNRDSGHGTVKADGIQSMARAFILAGAQSVLTTLWKVPDESASVFIQFFYQYLIDGIQSSLALQKAILSVCCFAKYSQYIHWSGYQLTGRNTYFSNIPIPLLQNRLDEPSIFPRLSDVMKLEKVVKDPTLTIDRDVQILKGCCSVNPSEVVKDFILSSYTHFSGGVFWINCRQPEMILSSIEYIQKIIGTEFSDRTIDEVLLVFDDITRLPDEESLFQILRNNHVHIIAVYMYSSDASFDKLIREIKLKIFRDCTIHNIEPLTMTHSTQRMVFNIMKKFDFTPTIADQKVFKELAELTLGSPQIIDMIIRILLDCLDSMGNEGVQYLGQLLQLEESLAKTSGAADFRCDLFVSLKKLIARCALSREQQVLLNSLSSFVGNPVPMLLVTEISRMIIKANNKDIGNLHQKLSSCKLLLQYPMLVIYHPFLPESIPEFKLVYIPQHVAQYVWNEHIKPFDKDCALDIVCRALYQLANTSPENSNIVLGLCSMLTEILDTNYKFVEKEYYQQVLRLCCFNSKIHVLDQSVSTSSSVSQSQESEGSTQPHYQSQADVQQASNSVDQLSEFPQLRDVESCVIDLIKWQDEKGIKQELRIYSRILHKWRQIATRLGIELGEIESIDADYRTSYDRILAVLQKWFENAKNLPNASEYPKSWEGLINLLEDTELGEVAKDLKKAMSSPRSNIRGNFS